MEILLLVLLEIVRTFVREGVTYFIKVFAEKRSKNEKTTPKLHESKKGGRSRK